MLSPGKHNLLQAERGGALPLIPYSFPLPQISLLGSSTCCVTLVVSKHNENVYIGSVPEVQTVKLVHSLKYGGES